MQVVAISTAPRCQVTRLTCALCCVLLLGSAITSKAQVPLWIQTTNAVEFFTNLASRLLLDSGYSFDAGHIPVYTNSIFAFSPDVHRVLQVAANLYDATTNRADRGGPDAPFLPSVFRPVFKAEGADVFIADWAEETIGTNWMNPPHSLDSPADAATVQPNDNIFGVPWIIGVKKGFPNFNEFALQSVVFVARKLQLQRPTNFSRPNATNQLFLVGISNVVAVEAWNAYASNYRRAVKLVVASDLTARFTFTNDARLDPRGGEIVHRGVIGTITNLSAAAWAGQGGDLTAPDPASFVIPLATNLVLLPDSLFRTDSQTNPFFTGYINVGANLVAGFEQTGLFPLPDFRLTLTNRLRLIMLDAETQRVIDYVQLGDLIGTRDLSAELASSGGDSIEQSLWDTNRTGGNTLSNPPLGVIHQVETGLGILDVPNWGDYGYAQPSGLKAALIDAFQAFCFATAGNTNLIMQAPFTPIRVTSQPLTWQANDPFVHFMTQDLAAPASDNGILREVPNRPVQTVRNIGRLNDRFGPWGGNPTTSTQPGWIIPYAANAKDPLLRSPDDWPFDGAEPLSLRLFSRVHRGTPWQTLYLKSAGVLPATWLGWLGRWGDLSARLAIPTNDHKLAGALVALLNTNAPAQLLSLNSTDGADWRQALDGVSVITNSAADAELLFWPPQLKFQTNLMNASSPQAAIIANAMIQARGSQPWRTVGDVLSTPELTDASPWLNRGSEIQANLGISDAAYEMLAVQLLPRLRPDSEGTALRVDGALAIQFTGYDGFPYRIEASSNLADWASVSTNAPTNGVFRYVVPDDPLPHQFYRSVVIP